METKNILGIPTIIAVTIAVSILVAFSATASAATTWYVDDDGSNSNDGTSGADAWQDISYAISHTSVLDGDTIMVGDGTYTITSTLMIAKQDLTITGNVAHPEKVVVQYLSLTNSPIFDMRASDAVIEGFKTTNGKSGFWFDQSGVTGCTISNCIIDNVREYGIYMKNGGSGHTIDSCTISNTGQTYAGAPAILIENSLDVTVNGNTLNSISDKGIYVRVCSASSTAERVEVTENIISGCAYPCIQVYQSPYTIVDGNTISSTNDKGINIIGPNANSAAERVELTNNIISGCPYDAILVTRDRYTYIHGNTVGPTGDKGISIADGENINNAGERIEVSGNTVTGTKWPGIQVAYEVPYTYIYNNILTGCNYYGGDETGNWNYASIHVDKYCDNTIVDSNDVSDGINGIQIWSDDCEVTNNEIYDMGMTYADTKDTGDGTYYNSGIIIGTNWLTNNVKPTGTTVTYNNIHDNYWGLYVRDYPSVLSVTAENNWWGDCSGPSHSTNPSGTGDAVSDNVDYDPWYGKIEIDIKPGSDNNPNSINLKSKGVVPVAVLTTDDFDASTVDPDSVTFAGAEPVKSEMCDVDQDGDDDMLFHFKTQDLDLDEDSTEATLSGYSYDTLNTLPQPQPICGTDTVNIVPAKAGSTKMAADNKPNAKHSNP